MPDEERDKLLKDTYMRYPSTSSTLWGHLLQKTTSPSLLPVANGRADQTANPPLAPVDRTSTTLRILLHDTQATLEKFSEHVDKLTTGVDSTHQDIKNVQKLFQHDRQNLLEETVELANRCQREIQKSVGKPAQVQESEEICKQVTAVDRRLDALDKRFDILHLLVQTQSQTLQSMQEQQVQLLSTMTSIVPLLQAIPLRVDNAKMDVAECVRKLQERLLDQRNGFHSRSNTSSSDTLAAPRKHSSYALSLSSPVISIHSKTPRKPRKRRREDYVDEEFPRIIHSNSEALQRSLKLVSQASQTLVDRPVSHNSHDNLVDSFPAPCSARSFAGNILSSQQSAASDILSASAIPVHKSSSRHRASTDMETYPDLLTIPMLAAQASDLQNIALNANLRPDSRLRTSPDLPGCLTSMQEACDRGSLDLEREPGRIRRSRSPDAPEPSPARVETSGIVFTSTAASTSIPDPSSPCSPFPTKGTVSTPVNSQPVPPPLRCSQTNIRKRSPRHTTSNTCVPLIETGTGDEDSRALSSSGYLGTPAHHATNRPMSLKDRRAFGLLANAAVHNEGKRYILLDDEDEDELSS